MSLPTLRLDDRTWDSLVEEAKRRIAAKCPTWTDFNPSDPGMMLVELMAWLTDTVLYQLNRVPEKNYIQFLELIGVRLRRPHPARTWVSSECRIRPTTIKRWLNWKRCSGCGSPRDRKPNGQPVTFVTRQPLQLTALKIIKTCSRYPTAGISEYEEVHNLTGDNPWETEIFQRPKTSPPRGTAVPHHLYFGDAALGEFGAQSVVGILVEIDSPKRGRFLLEWEAWDGAGWQPVHPDEDTTQGFQTSGKILFETLPAWRRSRRLS